MENHEALATRSLDKLHYVRTHPLAELTRKYVLTRPLQEWTIRYSYQEYFQALAQVLSQGRKLNMVSTYGSWKYPKPTECTTTTFPPAPPTYNYPPQNTIKSRN